MFVCNWLSRRTHMKVLHCLGRLLCWIVDNSDFHTDSGQSYYIYFWELAKHIHTDVFNSSCTGLLRGESYFLTISSCKFYLSFENSIHSDYITETFSGFRTAGTVPIALGPPRSNYENFAPGTFILHVNDFPDNRRLAEFSLRVHKANEAFIGYFKFCRF